VSAFSTLTVIETRLFLRDKATILLSVAQPPVVLLLLGAVPALREPSETFGGQRFIDYFAPSLLALSIAMLGLATLPAGLATYREKGVLRRLSTTPMRPSNLLVAQLLITLAATVVARVVVRRRASRVRHPAAGAPARFPGGHRGGHLGGVRARAGHRRGRAAGPHGHRCRNGSVPAGDVLRRGLPAEVPVARRRAAHRRVRPAGVAALDDAWLGVRLHHPASSTAVATLSQCDELAEIVALMDPAYAIRFTDAFGDSTVTSAHDGVQLVVA